VFTQEAGLISKAGPTNELSLMKCFTETIVSSINYRQTGEKSVSRSEFLEVLVRIAAVMQATSGKSNLGETLKQLLRETVFKKAKKTARSEFLSMLVNDAKSIELLQKNCTALWQAYNYFTHDKKNKVTLEECVALARHCQLDV